MNRTPTKNGRSAKRASPKKRAPAQMRSPAGGGRVTAAKRATAKSSEYLLRLYVAGTTTKSLEALANLKAICENHLAGRYRLEVVDLLENPALARGDQILALPALVRQLPPPVKKIIGDFSNAERVLVGLDLRPMSRASRTPLRARAEP